MPEPKKPKRKYNAPLDSQIDGLRLVPQRNAHPDAGPGEAARPGERRKLRPEEVELVEKLIEFLKAV